MNEAGTAPDFWRSKSFWNAFSAIVATVAARVLAPDWVPVVIAGFGFLQALFLRDTVSKVGAKVAQVAANGVNGEKAAEVEMRERAAAVSKLSVRERALLGIAEEGGAG